MHRPPDEYNPDDWDGIDHAEQSDSTSWLPNRQGQGSPEDLARIYDTSADRLEVFNGYTADWPEISKARKVAAGYRCTECRLHLTERWTELLHTHHINGDKSDNHLGNLRVLCIDCHNKAHRFVYSTVLPKDRMYLDTLRKEQGTSR